MIQLYGDTEERLLVEVVEGKHIEFQLMKYRVDYATLFSMRKWLIEKQFRLYINKGSNINDLVDCCLLALNLLTDGYRSGLVRQLIQFYVSGNKLD